MREQLSTDSPDYSRRRNRWLLVAVISILPLAGVVGHAEDNRAQLDLPTAEWSAMEMLEVDRRGLLLGRQKLTFGAFATTEMRRSYTQRRTARTEVSILGVQIYSKVYDKRKQSFRFVLDDGEGSQAKVFGLTRFDADEFRAISATSTADFLRDLIDPPQSDHNFLLNIYLGAEEEPWEMLFDLKAARAERKTYTAFLARGPGEVYRLVPLFRLRSRRGVASPPFGPIGYEFRDLADDQPVAAFSFLDDGQIYFNEGITDDQRLLMAAAASALLLLEGVD